MCEDANYGGRCIDPDVSEGCYNLWDFNDMLSSINTRDMCVRLWEHMDCQGDSRRVREGTPSHSDLSSSDVDFNDITSSIQLCPNQDPKKVVKFFLYDDSNNRDGYREIRWDDGNSIRQIRMNGHRRVKMYIHGYRGNAFEKKPQLIKNVYLREFRNQPVILVDWGPMADESLDSYDYVANYAVPKVATHVRRFISNMRSNGVISSMDQLHLIGHSLGGQMCGLIGQQVRDNHGGQKLGRISALDPAGPEYWDKEENRRIDAVDANFVDAIHTSASLGYYDRVAHADFFANPNRGNQPGECDEWPPNRCNHNKAVNFFAKSIYTRDMYGCRQEGSGSDRQCTDDCNRNIVVGEHLSEK